jgi:hypothetical protein
MSTGSLSSDLDDDDKAESGVMPFAAIAMVLALGAFAVELLGSQKVFTQDSTGSPSFAVPEADYAGKNRYEKKKRATGEWDLAYKFQPVMENDTMKIETYEEFKDRKK